MIFGINKKNGEMNHRYPKSYFLFYFLVENLLSPNIWDCPLSPTLHNYILYIMLNKYQLLFYILQYAQACRNLVSCNLGQELRIFLKEKKCVNEIYSWSRGFVFRQKFMIKYKWSMFASRDVCINFGKKTWSHLHYDWLYLNKVFTRHLNMECFSSRRFLQFSYLIRPLSLR